MEKIYPESKQDNEAKLFFKIFDQENRNVLTLKQILSRLDEILALNSDLVQFNAKEKIIK